MASVTAIVVLLLEMLLLFVGGVLIFSAHRARQSGAPYFPAPEQGIRAALGAADLRPGEQFYDLGAGTGNVLLIAEKEFGARATGFEISFLPFWIGKLNLFIHHSRAQLIAKNFFDADLAGADVVFCFLAIRTMQKMEDKIKAVLKPGARIIVYAFPLPTMTPIKTITIRGKWKMFIYSS